MLIFIYYILLIIYFLFVSIFILSIVLIIILNLFTDIKINFFLILNKRKA